MKSSFGCLVLSLAIAVAAAFAGYSARMFAALWNAGGISQERMNELTGGDCPSPLDGTEDSLVRLIKKLYDLPETDVADLDVKSVSGCKFEYLLESDFRGTARVRLSPSNEVRRVDFFNWSDDSLWNSAEPSFSAVFFSRGGQVYVYEEFRGRMFEMTTRIPSSLKQIGQGMPRQK